MLSRLIPPIKKAVDTTEIIMTANKYTFLYFDDLEEEK